MAAYLIDNPPKIRQFRPRREALWPVIGVHTGETYPDEVGPDTGAENLAAFIQRRTNPGCYHTVADSDSIIRLVPFDQAAYHIGTHGLNDRTIGISAATQAAKWNSLGDQWVDGTVRNMARASAEAARYIKATTGETVPARRITLAQALSGKAGFLAHGDADPGRRTDPGATFPWQLFLDYYAAEMADEGGDMPTAKEIADAVWADPDALPQIYRAVWERKLGSSGKSAGTVLLEVDADNTALLARVGALEATIGQLAAGQPLSAQEITSAARVGAGLALDDKIARAEVNLIVEDGE